MSAVMTLSRLSLGVVASLSPALLFAGCAVRHESDPVACRLVRNDDVHVVARLCRRAARNEARFICRMSVVNVSGKTIVVYDDQALPTVLHQPPDTADVFFGLTPMPLYADFYGCEGFNWRSLSPGESHEYRFEIRDPLRENSHYGNPVYDDPRSPLFKQMPVQLTWGNLRVRVGYLVLENRAVRDELETVDRLTGGLLIGTGSMERTVLDRQRNVAIIFSPSDLKPPRG